MINAEFVTSVADLTRKGTAVETVSVDLYDGQSSDPIAGRRLYQIVPSGVTAKDVTDDVLKTLPNPLHRAGTINLVSLESFIDFVNRMREPSTVLFADPKTNTIEAVFDYHDAVNHAAVSSIDPEAITTAPVSADLAALPRWGRFKARYAFPLSTAWKTWTGMNEKGMSQLNMAEFVEDNLPDVLDVANVGSDIHSQQIKGVIDMLGLQVANRAMLLKAARGLQIRVDEKVGSVVNTNTGEIQITYEERHATNESEAAPAETIKVPTAFVLLLQVFEGADAFERLVRLKYRREGRQIVWFYDIFNLKRAEELAFQDGCERISRDAGAPLFYATLGSN